MGIKIIFLNKLLFLILLFSFFLTPAMCALANEEYYEKSNWNSQYTISYSLNEDDSCEIIYFLKLSQFGNDDLNNNIFILRDGFNVTFLVKSATNSEPYDIHATWIDKELEIEKNHYFEQMDDGRFLHYINFEILSKGIIPSPPSGVKFEYDILISFKMDNVSINLPDYKRVNIGPLPHNDLTKSTNNEKITLQINLPNNPYVWSEVINVDPSISYATQRGNGESLVWIYDDENNYTGLTTINYKVKQDSLKISLDEATKQSLRISNISIWLGVIALLLGLISSKDELKKILILLKNKFNSTQKPPIIKKGKQKKKKKK